MNLSVQFTIIFVIICCFQEITSMDLREDTPTSVPYPPHYSSVPLRLTSTHSPFNPSTTFTPFIPTSTFSSFIPSRRFNPSSYTPSSISSSRRFTPSRISSSSNVAQFLVQPTTTPTTTTTTTTKKPLLQAAITNEELEDFESRRFLTSTDMIPLAVTSIPTFISDHIQAIRNFLIDTLAVIANTLDLFISSIQMGKSNVGADLLNIGKHYMDRRQSYLELIALISDDLMTLTTCIRKLPGAEVFRFIIKWPLEALQSFKNFLMSLIKPDDPDFQI